MDQSGPELTNTYELTVITRTEEEAEAAKKLIDDLNGKITETKKLGSRRLAYPIEKEVTGFYTSFDFTCRPKQILDLNRRLSLLNQILRHLIIIKKPMRFVPTPAPKVEKPEEKSVLTPVKPEEPVAEVKPEIKIEAPAPEKLPEEKPAKPEKAAPAAKPKPVKPEPKPEPQPEPKPEPIKKSPDEAETEDDRLRKLDEKLDELLKE